MNNLTNQPPDPDPQPEELSEEELAQATGGANAVEYGLITAIKADIGPKTTK